MNNTQHLISLIFFQTFVLSGKNGSVISGVRRSQLAAESSPITIAFEGRGNDVFLHWESYCEGQNSTVLKYAFPKGEHWLRMELFLLTVLGKSKHNS